MAKYDLERSREALLRTCLVASWRVGAAERQLGACEYFPWLSHTGMTLGQATNQREKTRDGWLHDARSKHNDNESKGNILICSGRKQIKRWLSEKWVAARVDDGKAYGLLHESSCPAYKGEKPRYDDWQQPKKSPRQKKGTGASPKHGTHPGPTPPPTGSQEPWCRG